MFDCLRFVSSTIVTEASFHKQAGNGGAFPRLDTPSPTYRARGSGAAAAVSNGRPMTFPAGE